jgi:phosphoserine phosphatase
MTKLILVRHGQTDWTKVDRVQGTLDIPLNSDGRRTSDSIAEELAGEKIAAVLSSRLSRSSETAERIALKHKLKVSKIKELDEINQGAWEGLLLDDIKKRWKKRFALWKSSPFSITPPKGEGIKDAYDRALSCVHKLIDKYSGETICVVSHGIIITLLKCHFRNLDPDQFWQHVPKPGCWESITISEQ